MNDEKLLKEIRNGDLISGGGFVYVVYRGMPERLEKLSWQGGQSTSDKRDPSIGMPVMIVHWHGSGYRPIHHSLN